MTFWILLAIAGGLSLISLRYRNMLFTLGATLGWFALLAHHLNTPPFGVTQGSFVHEALLCVFAIMGIAVMMMWARNRERGYTGYNMTKREEAEQEARYASKLPARGMMDLSTTEYRQLIHARMRQRRR